MIATFLVLACIVVVTALVFSQEKQTPKREPSQTSRTTRSAKPLDTPECRTAVHEAGHTIAAWMCSAVNKMELMTVEHKDGGRVSYTIHSADTPNGLWCLLVILLSGIAAEISVYGRTRAAPASSDLIKSREIAAELVEKDCLIPPWKVPDRGRTLHFEDMYASPLSSSEAIVLKRAYHMAHAVLSSHEKAHQRVVSMLLTKKSVGEADVEVILGTRAFTRFVGIIRPTFVMPKSKRE